jgi:hypothetical protein
MQDPYFARRLAKKILELPVELRGPFLSHLVQRWASCTPHVEALGTFLAAMASDAAGSTGLVEGLACFRSSRGLSHDDDRWKVWVKRVAEAGFVLAVTALLLALLMPDLAKHVTSLFSRYAGGSGASVQEDSERPTSSDLPPDQAPAGSSEGGAGLETEGTGTTTGGDGSDRSESVPVIGDAAGAETKGDETKENG